jgi:DNA-binding NtrC family response regulator
MSNRLTFSRPFPQYYFVGFPLQPHWAPYQIRGGIMSNRHEGSVVFVVDDEPVIASTIATILHSDGFDAKSFTDPLEAFRVAHFRAPDVLLSDLAMPFLSGIELAAKIKAFCPDCKVLLFSGEVGFANRLMHDSARQERLEILQKPVHPTVLLQKIQELLDSTSVAASPRLIDQNSASKQPVQSVTTPDRAYKKR